MECGWSRLYIIKYFCHNGGGFGVFLPPLGEFWRAPTQVGEPNGAGISKLPQLTGSCPETQTTSSQPRQGAGHRWPGAVWPKSNTSSCEPPQPGNPPAAQPPEKMQSTTGFIEQSEPCCKGVMLTSLPCCGAWSVAQESLPEPPRCGGHLNRHPRPHPAASAPFLSALGRLQGQQGWWLGRNGVPAVTAKAQRDLSQRL